MIRDTYKLFFFLIKIEHMIRDTRDTCVSGVPAEIILQLGRRPTKHSQAPRFSRSKLHYTTPVIQSWLGGSFLLVISTLVQISVGLNRLNIRPGLSGGGSALSEICAFRALGLHPRDVVLTEDELSQLSGGRPIPELLVGETTVEVKRITHQDADWRPVGRRRRDSSWQWSNTVRNGLRKITGGLMAAVAAEMGIRIRKHILVLVVPDDTSDRYRERVYRLANRILRDTETEVRTELVVTAAPMTAFIQS